LDLESNEETLTLKLSNGWLLPNKKEKRSLSRNLASNEINENDQAQ
jgi:hypothetical protein